MLQKVATDSALRARAKIDGPKRFHAEFSLEAMTRGYQALFTSMVRGNGKTGRA